MGNRIQALETLDSCEDHMHILNYCKTTACLISVISSMDQLLVCTDMTNYSSLGTDMYKKWILRWGN